MSRDHNYSCNAGKTALLFVFLGVGSDLGHAANVSALVYTLPVSAIGSTVNGVLFDGQFIWSAVQTPNGGALLKISQNGAIISSTTVGSAPDEMAFDGANVWVTDYTSSDVTIVNASGGVLKTIPLPSANPEGILFDGKYIWVANNGVGANSVSKFDVASQRLLATYSVGLNPDGLAYDGTFIWVTNSYNNNVWRINRDTGAFNDSYTSGIFPVSIVYDGANMWVGNGTGVNVGTTVSGTGTLAKIRAADGAILGTYTVGSHVRGLAFDGTSIWVCNGNDNTVSRLRALDVALLATYATGKFPRAAAFDGKKLWVANSGDNTLTIIAPGTTTLGTPTGSAESGVFGGIGSQSPGNPNARKHGIAPRPTRGIRPVIVNQREVVEGSSLGSMLDLLLDPN